MIASYWLVDSRCVQTEVAVDLQIQVEDVLFRLHKVGARGDPWLCVDCRAHSSFEFL
jgi:hypothetical protein